MRMSGNYCIVNGEVLPAGAPAVPAVDRSFSLGDGLFETIKVHAARAVWLDEHLDRLEKSARFARIGFPQKKSCGEYCTRLIEQNRISNGFLRITLSRGDSATGRFGDFPDKSTIAVTGANTGPADGPCSAAFAGWPVNERDPACYHKTTSRFSTVLAKLEADRQAVDEIVFVNTRGELTEGILSNIFWVKDGELFTPAAECGLLPGITRAKVIRIVDRLEIMVTQGRFGAETLDEVDEIFFTNSVQCIRPCVMLDKRGLTAGEVTKTVQKEIAQLSER